MKTPEWPIVFGGVAGVALAALYVSALDVSPLYLLNDEVFGALQAISLAATGRSLSGEWFPVYFRGLEFPPGRDPLFVYATAAAFRLGSVSEAILRLPTALVGVSCVVLAYFLGRRLFGRSDFAVLTALMLALTPAHFINSRIAIPTLWSVPWIMGWLLGLALYVERRDARALAAAMVCLGIAVFGYLGSALAVPLYVMGTVGVLFVGLRERAMRPYAIAAASVVLPLTLLGYWQLLHPERWREIVDYYVKNTNEINGLAPLISPSGWPNYAGLQQRVTSYWNHFDPSLLFLGGDRSPRYSTDRSGVFLLSSLVLLPVGIVQAARTSVMGRLLVYCFFATPAVAALRGDVQIQRTLPFVVFGALLSAWGLVWLITRPSPRLRRAALLLGVLGGVQFALFTVDYFTHYRLRSGESRGGNLRGAIEDVIRVTTDRPETTVYLSDSIPNADVYWRFYDAVAGGGARRAEVVSPATVLESSASGSALLIAGIDDVPDLGRPLPPRWRLRTYIYELDGPAFFTVYERSADR
jgi:4-amino-4-deoxy-L-arabinose transferase-like glycosyltransferase